MKISFQPNEIRNRQFFSIFLTSVFSSMGSLIAECVDGVLIGAFLGSDAMAAFGIASPYFSLNELLHISLLVACQNLCTAEVGRGHNEGARRIFSFALWTSVALASIVSVVGFVFPENVAALFGAGGSTPSVKADTVAYLRNLFPGTVFYCFMSVAVAALQIDGEVKLVRLSGLLVGALDIVGNLLNIFVFHGGLAGMGVATTFSYIGAALVLLPYFRRKNALFSLNPRLYSFKIAPKVFSVGYTEAIVWILEIIVPSLINRIIISNAGTNAMAGMSIQRNLTSLVEIIYYGLADATMMQLGICFGESDRVGVKNIMRCILTWLCVFTAFSALLLLMFSGPVASLYCNPADTALLAIARVAVITLAISVPFTALAKVSLRAVQSLAKNKYAMTLSVAQIVLLPCPLTLLLCMAFRDTGALIAYTVSEAVAGALGFFLYRKAMGKAETFPVPETDIFRGTAETLDQVVDISRRMLAFCVKHGCDRRLSYKLSLCTEEMGCTIILDALQKTPESKPLMNFVVVLHPDEIVMRITDNCPDQQLRDRAQLWKPDSEQPEHLIGIRMCMELSTDFKYVRLLNANNTIMTFERMSDKTIKA